MVVKRCFTLGIKNKLQALINLQKAFVSKRKSCFIYVKYYLQSTEIRVNENVAGRGGYCHV
jgi:hypothetical protein